MITPDGERPAPLARNDGYETVEPRANALVESLRAFGYSPQTAIADLVDNSLSADASTVTVHFQWDAAASWVAVADDGRGMTEDQLREAMRPGSSDPLSERAQSDLGRFGLGLKTASFSQCRRLVVMSAVVPGQVVARTWDLDTVGETGQWRLLTELDPEDRAIWDRLGPDRRGTLVLWRRLDRLVDPEAPSGVLAEAHFYAAAERVVEHLRMIFHRFLRGPRRVTVWVNNRDLKPWDPFVLDASATQPLGDEHLTYRGWPIRIRSYVLPHVTRLTTREYKAAQGTRGWTAQQGFYVYRNRRLIVAGDWLGLGLPREEATKLARIQLDLPNTMDQDWQLDVRKSVVRAPGVLVPQLRRIAEVARRASVQVYRHRGKALERGRLGDRELAFVWEQLVERGKIAYRINRRHPLVETLLQLDGGRGRIEALLRLAEETVPVPLIILDHAGGESRQAEPFELDEPAGMRVIARDIVQAMRDSGLGEAEVARRLLAMEPFAGHPDVVDKVVNQELP